MNHQQVTTNATLLTIIGTGLFAGLLDGIAAELLYFISGGRNPLIVFQYIASGVFGRAAFAGGTIAALSGLILHLVIAFSWTSLFFLAYPRVSFLSQKYILAGIAYGLLIWLVMNKIVLPLSYVRQQPFDGLRALTGIVVLMVAVGVPISLSAHRFYSTRIESD